MKRIPEDEGENRFSATLDEKREEAKEMSTESTASSASWRLTARQRSIIDIIAKMNGNAVSISAISEKLGVSSRTVLRELPDIEKWFDENDFKFVRKPGVGLSIDEEPEDIQLIEELLNMEKVQTDRSKRERRRQLLGELLCAQEPIKSYVFLSRFQISQGTLTRDLDALDKWLSTYQIKLVRRPGAGIMLEGNEIAFRQAIANAALEFMDEGEILKLLRGREEEPQEVDNSKKKELKNRLFDFAEPEVISFVEEILLKTEKELNIKYTDSGYMALVVHLSLTIRRLQTGEKIEMDPEEFKNLSELSEYSVAEQIAARISDEFQLAIPKEEIGFITMHLTSARIWPQTRRVRSQLQTINTRQMTMMIVDEVEKELGLPFHSCTKMIEELTSHMDAMVSRLSMNIHLENTQGNSIRENYPDIYKAVERACRLFGDRLCIDDISSSEITFVVMHFAAAAEELREEQKKVSVAVVCPSGMGASRMLAANLMRSFHNIEICQIVSAFSLDPETLREKGIDLVISTVPLQIDFPYICVSPIPQAQDVLVITRTVDSIAAQRNRKVSQRTQAVISDCGIDLKEIRSLTRTGEEICQLLDHFLIRDVSGDIKIEDLLGHAAGLFAEGIRDRHIISQDLALREKVSNTFIPELNIHLLHCRTTAVEHCRFGYLRLEKPSEIPAGSVFGAVLLLAPLTEGNECVEVISRISMLLVEDEKFLQALKNGDTGNSYTLAEYVLKKYYQNLITKQKSDG